MSSSGAHRRGRGGDPRGGEGGPIAPREPLVRRGGSDPRRTSPLRTRPPTPARRGTGHGTHYTHTHTHRATHAGIYRGRARAGHGRGIYTVSSGGSRKPVLSVLHCLPRRSSVVIRGDRSRWHPFVRPGGGGDSGAAGHGPWEAPSPAAVFSPCDGGSCGGEAVWGHAGLLRATAPRVAEGQWQGVGWSGYRAAPWEQRSEIW